MIVRSEIVLVTPAQAKAWLSSNNVLNRNLRHRLVDKYATDMRDGHWHISHQGIGFYEDGSLADGQHRLSAVVMSGVPIQMMVVFDIPRESAKAIDQHAQRKMEDALRLGGAPSWITKDAIAIVRWMASAAVNAAQLSPDQVEQYATRFESEIRLVCELQANHKRGITTAGVGCMYVLALLGGEDRDAIRRFSQILREGVIDGAYENAAIRLREYLLQNPMAWNGTMRASTARRAQRAIQAFCRRIAIAKLYEPADWIYPFPAASAVLPGFSLSRRMGSEAYKQVVSRRAIAEAK